MCFNLPSTSLSNIDETEIEGLVKFACAEGMACGAGTSDTVTGRRPTGAAEGIPLSSAEGRSGFLLFETCTSFPPFEFPDMEKLSIPGVK